MRGRFFIDASGDGDLAYWAVLASREKPEVNGMMYPVADVSDQRRGRRQGRARAVADRRAADGGSRGGGDAHVPAQEADRPAQPNPPGAWANPTQLRTEDGGAIDGTNVDEPTARRATGRQQALDAFTFIRDRTPGFEDSYIVDIAPQIGIRETRRIIGPYQVTESDVLDCVDFPDTIGVNGWPVEVHVAGTVEFRWQRKERGFNQLPFRIILPGARGDGQRVANLYVAAARASMTTVRSPRRGSPGRAS